MDDPKLVRPLQKIAVSAAVAAASVLIATSRRTDAITNPQFWAEDGRNWFADAYNIGGWVPFLTPEAGYLQTFSRLIGAVSVWLPFGSVPLFFNLSAIAVQVVVAVYICSDRMAGVFEHRRARIVLAFLYLAMPHSWEVHANVTNAQWNLALLALLIVVSRPAESVMGRAFDIGVLAVSSLSGPFALILLPVAVLRLIVERDRKLTVPIVVLLLGGAIQAASLLTSVRPVQQDLGVGLDPFLKIIARHIVLGPFVGENGFQWLLAQIRWNTVTAALITLIGARVAIYLGRRARFGVAALLIFAVLIVGSALVSPAVSAEPGQWRAMADSATAIRYWFFPSFAIYALLIYGYFSAADKKRRYVSGALLALVSIGVVVDWREPPFDDLNFASHAEAFENARPGEEVTIPINPNWRMVIRKK